MSSKMKIILVVFGLVAFLFFVQYVTSTIASENKREKYMNAVQESFEEEGGDPDIKPSKPKTVDDLPNEPVNKKKVPSEDEGKKEAPAAKDEGKPSSADRAFRIKLLDAIDKAFLEIERANEHKDQKPIVFDKLSEKTKAEELKASATLELDVRQYVEKHLAQVQKESGPVKDPMDARQIEKLTELKDSLDGTLKAIRNVLENINPYMDASEIPHNTGKGFELPWNPVPLSKIQEKLTDMKGSKITNAEPLPTLNPTDKPIPLNSKKTEVVEGFENIRNYAFF